MQDNHPIQPPPMAACGGPALGVLRRLDAGELHGGELQRVRMHTDDCAECRSVLQDFTVTRAALRTTLPFAALEARLERSPRRFLSGWRTGLIAAGALATVLGAVLLAPRSIVSESRPTTQTKGTSTLDFVVKSGEQVRAGNDGDRLRPGDALEFRYDSNGLGYVLIVGVDADGKVFPYVTSGDRSATAGKGVTLSPNAVVLDADLRSERVFALFSREPIGVDEVKPAARDGLVTAGGIESLLALPGFPNQATILIRKAAR